MTDAIGNALAGMKAAQADVQIRSRNVANVRSEDYTPARPVQTSTPSGPVVKPQALEGSRVVLPNGDFIDSGVKIEEDLVGMKMAEVSYKASAKVLGTAHEMTDALLKAME